MIQTYGMASVALLALAQPAPAGAADIVVITQGEQFQVDYPPGHTGNIVGGGQVRVVGQGESQRVVHLEQRFTRQRPGLPVFVGGSHGHVAYLQPGRGQPDGPRFLAQR
jgi:hypothetical protein